MSKFLKNKFAGKVFALLIASSFVIGSGYIPASAEDPPVWNVEVEYKKGDTVTHEGKIYNCVCPHTSQADWAPTIQSSLWMPVCSIADGDAEVPDFVQPIGGHNAYKIGDKVKYIGRTYECLQDNTVWDPEVAPRYWKKIEG